MIGEVNSVDGSISVEVMNSSLAFGESLFFRRHLSI